MLNRSRLSVSILACMLGAVFTHSEEKVLNTTTFRFPNALPNSEFAIRKLYDSDTRKSRIASNSEYIKSAQDLVNLEFQEEILLRKKFGALAGRIRAKYSSMETNENIEVIVHLKEPDGIAYLDKTKHVETELKAQSLALASLQPVISIKSFAAKHGLEPKGKRSSKSFRCNISKGSLQKLMFDPDIAAIDEYREEMPLQGGNPNLSTLAASAYNHSTLSVPTWAGTGINAATFETGIDPSYMSCFGGLNGNRIDQRTQPWMYWEHSQLTLRCLMYAAPGSNLYHRQSTSFEGLGDSTYIADSTIRSMSLSYTRGGTSPYNETFPEFRIMDAFAYRWPYPVFNNPIGNAGYKHVANWQNYNAISVGNVRHTNQSTWELVDTTNVDSGGCTQTTNPPAKYGTARDREMPMIVVPGWTPTPEAPMVDGCLPGQLNTCGTSLSAPIANGMSTNVMAADSRMWSWPEKVRVAILATARNVSGSYWVQGQDLKDGTGVIHGADAVSFAQNHTLASVNGTAYEQGMYAGALYASDFSTENITFNIKVPNPKPSGKHLRAVLTWDSNPLLNSATNELSDLDLYVSHNLGSRTSSSWNSNVEIVDIPSSSLTAGSNYTVGIIKYFNRIPAGSPVDYFYYAIGWTWVAD